MPEISNTDDTIDSRDVIERISELESEAVSRYADGREDLSWGEVAEGQQGDSLDDDERAELDALRKLADQGSDYAPDWEYGEVLIRDSYFEEYARELASDLGIISGDESWPLTCIDWEKAADQLKQDYTEVDFDGVGYWIR